MSFLAQGYEIPQSESGYLKLKQGENNFRILSSAVVGYEYWNTQDKPVRLKELPKKRPSDIRPEKNNTFKIKHFWAFTVWNYEDSAVQIMEVTQKTIMNAIKSLVDNAKWGDPKEYDITINREGEKLDTEYAVMPNPKTPLDAVIVEQVNKKKVNLDALFTGGNPFEEVDNSQPTMTPDEQSETLNQMDAIEVEQ